jgi:hypothetical protein
MTTLKFPELRRDNTMKKFLAVAILASASSMSYADPDAGCGVGSSIWAGNSGLLPKALASFTNGFFFQSVSITAGVFGCNNNGVVSSSVRITMFTGSNIDKLASEMSVGQGETLNTLADLMGVPSQDKPAFFQATRDNFSTIFADDKTTAGQVLSAMNSVLAKDASLAAYVVKA